MPKEQGIAGLLQLLDRVISGLSRCRFQTPAPTAGDRNVDTAKGDITLPTDVPAVLLPVIRRIAEAVVNMDRQQSGRHKAGLTPCHYKLLQQIQ
jgi:hypothetical protein